MEEHAAVPEADEALLQLKSLSKVVDELVKQRAIDGPFTLEKKPLPPTSALLQPEDYILRPPSGLAAALTRTQGRHDGSNTGPYPHAKAAAAEVARITSALGNAQERLKATTSPRRLHEQTQQDYLPAAPGNAGPGSDTASNAAVQAALAGVQALLALPGQLPYRKLLHTAKRSRAQETQAFVQELDELDHEIDAYLAAERQQRAEPSAALVIQTAWRARGPRVMFNRYYVQRRSAELRQLARFLRPLRQLIGALQHQRERLLRTAFEEWKLMCDLKTALFCKVIRKLKASMLIDVRDSQSPNHLWRLCTAPGEDPWSTRIGLGAVCKNMIIAQYPWRKMKMYFTGLRAATQSAQQLRGQAVARLERAEQNRTRNQLHAAFRFWYRWAMIRLSERLQINAPLFRPRMEIWDAWLWEHTRSNELKTRVALLHRGFRMRHCFTFWRNFTARNRKLRQAWMSAAVPQIESLMRYTLGCLKANWVQNKAQRRMRNAAFTEWLRLARRNVLVRKIARQAERNSRMCIMKLHFRRLREWCRMSKLLNASATVQMLQRRPLCLVPLCAWTGDHTNMWFVAAWHAWRSLAVGRLRMRCWLVQHIHKTPMLTLELAFTAWRKVIELQREHTAWVAEQRALRDAHTHSHDPSHNHTNTSSPQPTDGPSPFAAQGRTGSLERPSVSHTVSHSPVMGHTDGHTNVRGNQSESVCEVGEEGDLGDELPDGSVHVSCADYPPSTLWRALLPAYDPHTPDPATGVNPSQLMRLVRQLAEVEGPFLPSNDESAGDNRQLVFEVCDRSEVTLGVRRCLDEDADRQIDLWLDPHTPPDPTLWQRLVGLAACSATPHPEAPCGTFVDPGVLPFAREIGVIRTRQAIARLRVPIIDHSASNGTDKGTNKGSSDTNAGTSHGAKANASAGNSGGHADTSSSGNSEGHTAAEGGRARRSQSGVVGCGGGVALKVQRSYAGMLTEDEQVLFWLHKLALAEHLLEGCVTRLLGTGPPTLPLVYTSVRQALPAARDSALLQGDLLVMLFTRALQHDLTYMAAAKQYRANRDQVITMGMSLHKHAMALNRHCPEFTLTYPSYNPTDTWKVIMDRVDNEDPDAPPPPRVITPPPPHTHTVAIEEPNPAQKLVRSVMVDLQGAHSVRAISPKRSQASPTRGRLTPPGGSSHTLSTTERIKMEMMGLSPPGTAANTAPQQQTPRSPQQGGTPRQGTPPSPPKETTSRAATPPRTAPAPASKPSTPPAADTSGTGDSLDAGATDSSGTGRGISVVIPKPMSLEDMQAKGVVLGAAAAAILAAKAAAAKRAQGGHRVNQAEVAQILAKPQPYKAAWRPSGYRKQERKARDLAEPHTPKVKRLPPLPVLRSTSPKPDNRDQFASGFFSGAGSPMGAAGAGGAAAGDLAFRAMMAAQSSGGAGHVAHTSHAAEGAATQGGRLAMVASAAAAASRSLGGAGQYAHVPHHMGGVLYHEHTHLQTQQPAESESPRRPYRWFDEETRLFPTVADVPRPVEVPSMHELHHRANKLNAERLDTTTYSLPLMPAIIFSEWGEGPRSPAPPTKRTRPQPQGTDSASPTQQGVGTGDVQTVDSGVQGSSQAQTGAKVQAPPAEITTSSQQGVGVLVSGEESPTSQLKKRATHVMEKLNLTSILSVPQDTQGEGHASYRQHLGQGLLSCEVQMERVSGDGDISPTPRDDEGTGDTDGADIDMGSRSRVSSQGPSPDLPPSDSPTTDHQPSVAASSTFHVSPEQLNVYLGNYMRHTIRTLPAPSPQPADTDTHQGLATSRTHVSNTDTEFDLRYDPDRVVATPHTRHRSLLEGYDLRSELRDLMGSEAAAQILISAEDALMGLREMSAEEHEAVTQELEKLEAELAKNSKYNRRRSPTHRQGRSPQHRNGSPVSRSGSMSGAATRRASPDAPYERAAAAAAAGSAPGSPPRHASPSRFAVEQQRQQSGSQLALPHADSRRRDTSPKKERSAGHGQLPSTAAAAAPAPQQPAATAAKAAAAAVPPLALMTSDQLAAAAGALSAQQSMQRRAEESEVRDSADTALGSASRLAAASPASRSQPASAAARSSSPRRAAPAGPASPRLTDTTQRNTPSADPRSLPRQGSSQARSGAAATSEWPVQGVVDSASVVHSGSMVQRPGSVSPWDEDGPTHTHNTAGAAAAPQSQDDDLDLLQQASRPGTNTHSGTTQGQRKGPAAASQAANTTAQLSPRDASVARRFPADVSSIFPDRPTTGDSITRGGYPESVASSGFDSPTRYGSTRGGGGDDQRDMFEISVYHSLERPQAHTDGDSGHKSGDDVGPSQMFAGVGAGGRRTRRKSNLRGAAAVVGRTTDLRTPADQGQAPPGAATTNTTHTHTATLDTLTEDYDAESAVELEALRAMWCSAPYSGGDEVQGALSLPHPESQPAAAVSQLIAAAAEADWQRYEKAAERLVDQLSTALSQREAADRMSPLSLDRPRPHSGGTVSARSSPLAVLGSTSHGAQAAKQQGQVAGPHHLQRALSLMEDNLAAAIDPDRLTGFHVSTYPDRLSDLMSRLVVAPMATRYLFWKKVQSMGQLRQRLMEDRALEEQLRDVAYAATFTAGHAPHPSGSNPPDAAAAHAAAAPAPAATGAPLGLIKPAGWSSGAVALATARRVPWATAVPTESLRPQPTVMHIAQPIVLRPRDDTPAGTTSIISGVDPPVVGGTNMGTSIVGGTSMGTSTSMMGASVGTSVGTTPRLNETFVTEVPRLPLNNRGWGAGDADTEPQGPFFPLTGHEALAARLAALLEARRAAKAAAAFDEPAPSARGAGGASGALTDRSVISHTKGLDEEETEVNLLSDLTIAIHKDTLTRHQQRLAGAATTQMPGRGTMLGWAPPPVLPAGYTGRDGFHDTSDPFTYAPRPRANAAPNPLPRITLKGAALANVSLARHEAEALAQGVVGSGLSMTISARRPPTPPAAPIAPAQGAHLPSPTGQLKPWTRTLPPLAPVSAPPAYPAAEAQPGNVLFTTPHEPAYVSYEKRALDNVFVPGPHALGVEYVERGIAAAEAAATAAEPAQPSARSVINDNREYVEGSPWTPTLSHRDSPFPGLSARVNDALQPQTARSVHTAGDGQKGAQSGRAPASDATS